MAQLTMQRSTLPAYEGRVSINQASEMKPDLYKLTKNESSDHFQKSLVDKSEPHSDAKKLSDRTLKRRDESEKPRTNSLPSKRAKTEQSSQQTQTQGLASKDVISNESEIDQPLFQPQSTSASETITQPQVEELVLEDIELPFLQTESSHGDVPSQNQLKDDLLFIASLSDASANNAPLFEIANYDAPTLPVESQMEASTTVNEIDLEQADDSAEPQEPHLSNTLLSAALINTNTETAPVKDNPVSAELSHTPLPNATLFSLDQNTQKTDLEEISELSISTITAPKETVKQKRSLKPDTPAPEQLHFAFMDKVDGTELKPINTDSIQDMKAQVPIESNTIKPEAEMGLTVDANDALQAEETGSAKSITHPEVTLPQSSQENSSEPFAMMVKPSEAQTTLFTSSASSTPSIMAAPNQTAPEQVAVRLVTALSNGDDQIHIRLTPEDLGEITIKLNISDQRVNALIQSDNAETLKLLQKDSQTLENALKESGFTLESHNMEFSFSGGQSRQEQAALQQEMGQLRTSLLDDDMLSTLTELSALETEARDYVLTPTKVDIHI